MGVVLGLLEVGRSRSSAFQTQVAQIRSGAHPRAITRPSPNEG